MPRVRKKADQIRFFFPYLLTNGLVICIIETERRTAPERKGTNMTKQAERHARNLRMIRAALSDLGATKIANRYGQEWWKIQNATVSFNGVDDNARNGSAPCNGVYVVLPRKKGFFVAAEKVATLDLEIAKAA